MKDENKIYQLLNANIDKFELGLSIAESQSMKIDPSKVNLNNFLKLEKYTDKWKGWFTCKSGQVNVSIVAGKYFYSTPRENMDKCNYTHFEIALFDKEDNWLLPSKAIPILENLNIGIGEYEYNEEDEDFQNAVLGYVKMEDIVRIIINS